MSHRDFRHRMPLRVRWAEVDLGTGELPAGQSTSYESIANPNIDRDFLAASISYAF